MRSVSASEGVAQASAWFVYLSGGLNLARRGTPYIIGSAANADNRRTASILAEHGTPAGRRAGVEANASLQRLDAGRP